LTPEQAASIPGSVAGVPLHPSFLYEIVFHLAAFALLNLARARLTHPGESFTFYLVGYAVFRFVVEFVRGNEAVFAGLTRPQLFLAACLPLAGWQLARTVARRRRHRAEPSGTYTDDTPRRPRWSEQG